MQIMVNPFLVMLTLRCMKYICYRVHVTSLEWLWANVGVSAKKLQMVWVYAQFLSRVGTNEGGTVQVVDRCVSEL